MKRIALAAVAALMAATPVAVKADTFYAPPERYRSGFAGEIVIIARAPGDIGKYCRTDNPLAFAYGCARIVEDPLRCIVFIPDRTLFNIGFPIGPPFLDPETILKHELGHCHGWPAHHPR